MGQEIKNRSLLDDTDEFDSGYKERVQGRRIAEGRAILLELRSDRPPEGDTTEIQFDDSREAQERRVEESKGKGPFPGGSGPPERPESPLELLGESIGKTSEGRNIFVNNRGSMSSEFSATMEVDGKFINFPTIFNGKILDPEQAFRKVQGNSFIDGETGRKLKFFDTEEEAINAAEKRSASIGTNIRNINDPSVSSKIFKPGENVEPDQTALDLADPRTREERFGVFRQGTLPPSASGAVQFQAGPLGGSRGEASGEGAEFLLQSTIGAASDAFVNSLSVAESAGQSFRDIEIPGANTPDGKPLKVQDALEIFGLGGKINIPATKFRKAGDPASAMARGMMSFIIGMGVLKTAGAATVPASFGSSFLSIDREQNIASLLNELIEPNPGIRQAVLDFLDNTKTESETKKALNNLLEDLALTGLAVGVFKALKEAKTAGITPLMSEEGNIRNPFRRSQPDEDLPPSASKILIETGQPLPPEIRQYVEIRGKVFDVGTHQRIRVNWDRTALPDKVRLTQAGARSLSSEDIEKAVGPVRKLETVEKEAVARLDADVQGEMAQFFDRDLSVGFSDVDMTVARFIKDDSAIRLYELKEAVLAGRQGAEEAIMDHWPVHVLLTAKEQAMSAGASRLLGARRIIIDPSLLQNRLFAGEVDDLIEKFKTESNMTPRQLAVRLDAIESPEQLDVMATQAALPGKFSAFLEYWINGLLTNPQTHVVNMSTNSMFLMWQIPERFLAAGLGKVLGGPDIVRVEEVTGQLYGSVKGMNKGFRLFAKNIGRIARLKEPELSDEFVKLDISQGRQPAITAKNLGITAPGLSGAVDLLGEGFRTPGKLLMTADDAFKAVGYQMELEALAYRQAAGKGFKRGTEEFAEDVLKTINNPPESLKMEVLDFARYATFTLPPGKRGKAIRNVLDTIPALRIIVPFFNTPNNLIKVAAERTPLAFLSPAVRADLRAGGAKRDLALAKIGLSSTVGALIASLAMEGQITGGYPRGAQERNIWKRLHRQPYSFRIIDKETGEINYYSFSRFDPITTQFGLIADFVQIAGMIDQEDRDNIALAISGAIARNITSRTWLSGLSKSLDGLADGDFSRFLENFAGTLIPLSSGTAAVERTLSPELSDFRTVDPALGNDLPLVGDKLAPEWQFVQRLINKAASRVPGWSDTLPGFKNLWGEIQVLQGGLGPDIASPIYTSTEADSPIDREMLEHKVFIARPQPIIAGVKLNPEEWERYQILAGSEAAKKATGLPMKEFMNGFIKSESYLGATDGPDGSKNRLIRGFILGFRDVAIDIMIGQFAEFPDLRDEVIALKLEQAGKLVPQFE